MKGALKLLLPLLVAAGTARALVWPGPPDAPRIKFVSVFPCEDEMLEEKSHSFFKKSIWFLLGISRKTGRPRAESTFQRPTGVYVTGETAYVADLGRRQVIKYDLATGRTVFLPGSGSILAAPVGVAATRGGRLFVTDSAKGRVFIFDAEGHPDGRLPAPPGGWLRPTGLAINEARNLLYVADTGRHAVQVYRLGGEYVRTFGRRGNGPGQFNFPTYLHVEENSGRLLVCDSLNSRVQVFGSNGEYGHEFGEAGDRPGYLARPRGLGMDSEGNIYVADGALETIQVFDSRGRLLLFFGTSGGEPGNFSLPGGLFVDRQDRIFVADTYNARLQMFQYLPGAGS